MDYKYKIVFVGDKFVPKVIENGVWMSISSNLKTWVSPEFVLMYCAFDTLKEAEEILKMYKETTEILSEKLVKYVE